MKTTWRNTLSFIAAKGVLTVHVPDMVESEELAGTEQVVDLIKEE